MTPTTPSTVVWLGADTPTGKQAWAQRRKLCLRVPQVLTAWRTHSWGTIPAVRVAQLEKTVSLPPELLSTWASLQRHFGLASDSGNMMSNLVLNFSLSEEYIFKINTGLPDAVTGSEEEFARVAREMEGLAVPVYHHIVRAILAWARGDRTDCLEQVRGVASQLRPLLSSYYDRVHDARIARSVWLSHVQGFYAWAAGYQDPATGEWVTFDGLSGNQVLLFQVLDSFLGIEPYLTREVLERNVPALQREFCSAISRHTFRHRLGEDNMDGQIRGEFTEIVKRLRVCRLFASGIERRRVSNPNPGFPHGSSDTRQGILTPARPRKVAHDGREVAA